MRALYIVIASLTLSACAQLPILTPPAQSDFKRTLYYARRNVDAGNYRLADRLIDEFMRSHPGTREAREIAFWKAAYMVDPANYWGSLTGGIAGLDGYLAADSAGWYRNEAMVLRRTAAVAQGLAASRAAIPDVPPKPGTKDTVVVVSRSREEEIVALKAELAKSKEELAKLSAELDRIKKRLANPRN
ncbi:MAG: hypothetical protein M3P26_09725 [Gemmatimonadota bacterium]|nr:hypothetical protein [Gemmatimonadota bacterium]